MPDNGLHILYYLRKFRKSFSFKFLLAFFLIIVIPVLIIGFISANVYVDLLLKQISERHLLALEQLAGEINNDIRELSLNMAEMVHQGKLIELIENYEKAGSPQERFRLASDIDDMLYSIFGYGNIIESGAFFYNNSGYYNYKNYPANIDGYIREQPWFKQALENPGSIFVLDKLSGLTLSPSFQYYYSLCISPQQFSEIDGVRLIHLTFKSSRLNNLLNKAQQIMQSDNILIIDSSGTILLSGFKDQLDKNLSELDINADAFLKKKDAFSLTINSKIFLASYYPIEKTGWKVINLTDYEKITRDISRYNVFIFMAFLFFLLIFLAFSVLFFVQIIAPLKKLKTHMGLVERGDFTINSKSEGSDEIAQLSNAFHDMVIKLDQLTKEKEQNERARLKAELEALQFQINPHFIANTLNSIRLMAMMANNENIKAMAESLIRFFSYIYKWESNHVKLRESIANLENYIYIMKVRFGDKFRVTYEIDEAVKELYILKMVLQPVVENAIIHGISDLERECKIEIKARLNSDKLLISVRDNGKGINPGIVDDILNDTHDNEHALDKNIGLSNVIRRIKYNYGDKYSLAIESKEGLFTCVSMSLPVIT